jgi:hypothetical protein
VDPRPAVDIASAADERGPQLGDIRGAVRLDDGGIVVANGESGELLAFDARGRFGGRVAGPRFASLDRVGRTVGGFWAWDGSDLRLSRFDARGRLTDSRQIPLSRIDVFPRLEGVFPDGSLLLSARPGNVFTVSPLPRREPITLLRYTFAPPRLDTLRAERGPEEFTSGSATSALRQPAPFGRTTFVATAGAEWWVGDSGRPEVRAYDERGRLLRVLRLTVAPRRVSPEDREQIRRDFLRRARGTLSPAAARDLAARLPFPQTYPAFAGILLDANGNVWVQDGDPARAAEWTVLAADGRMLGSVSLPQNLRPFEIGADHVLGRWTGPDGAEHVRLYLLRK